MSYIYHIRVDYQSAMGSVIARKYFMICLNRGLAKGSGYPWRSDQASGL